MTQSDKDLEIQNLKKDLEIQKLKNELAQSKSNANNTSSNNNNNNSQQQSSTVVITGGGGSHSGQRQVTYCGTMSWLIGCFLFPCICCCPVDKKWV